MATVTRLYAVKDTNDHAITSMNSRLVEASTRAQALRHVAEEQYEVTVPNTKEVAALMAKGVSVEVAKEQA